MNPLSTHSQLPPSGSIPPSAPMAADFSSVEDVESYASIPEGVYLCRITDVRDGVSRDGSTRWALRLEVVDGDYAGRTAGWDGITWSDKGLRRVKHVLDKLGFDVSGRLEVHRGDLLGRQARVQFTLEEREDPLTGIKQVRLRVPYLGYSTAAQPASPF
jgi:hypothetical protein